jgi:uncharacterized membrane protein YphA (DoxX/SURF4 family)
VLPPSPNAATAARLAVQINAATMLIAGAALGTGIAPRSAPLILAGCLQPTNAVGHAFWSANGADDQARELIAFLSNVAITGGLLSLYRHAATGEQSASQKTSTTT